MALAEFVFPQCPLALSLSAAVFQTATSETGLSFYCELAQQPLKYSPLEWVVAAITQTTRTEIHSLPD